MSDTDRHCYHCDLAKSHLKAKEASLKNSLDETEYYREKFEGDCLAITKNEYNTQAGLYWLRQDKREAERLREVAADRFVTMRGVAHLLEQSAESLKKRLGDIRERIAGFRCTH